MNTRVGLSFFDGSTLRCLTLPDETYSTLNDNFRRPLWVVVHFEMLNEPRPPGSGPNLLETRSLTVAAR